MAVLLFTSVLDHMVCMQIAMMGIVFC